MSRIPFHKISQVSDSVLSAAAVSFTCWSAASTWIAICGLSSVSVVTLLGAAAFSMTLCSYFAPMRTWQIPLAICAIGMTWFLPNWLSDSLAVFARSGYGTLSFVLPATLVACLICCLCQVFSQLRPGKIDRLQLLGFAIGTGATLLHQNSPLPMSTTATVLIIVAAALRMKHAKKTPIVTSEFSLASVGCGVACVGGLAMTKALFTLQLPLLATAFLLICLSVCALTTAFGRLLLKQPPAWFLLAAFSVCLPWLLTQMPSWNLHWNATINRVILLLFVRSVQVGVVCCAGFGLTHAIRQIRGSGQNHHSRACDFVTGTCVGCVLVWTAIRPEWIYAIGCFGIIAPLVTATGRVRHFAAVSSFALLLVCMVSSNSTQSTSQILFSSRAAAGYRTGAEIQLIAQSNSIRLLDSLRSAEGEFTAWKVSADTVEFRDNGHVVGQHSINTFSTPRPITETLPSLLPVALHPNPQSILLLNDVCGSSAAVCQNFPLHTIVSVNACPAKYEFVQRIIEATENVGQHVTYVSAPVETAICSNLASQPFDVVVANTLSPLNIKSASQLSFEFYRRIHQQLAADGLFCQRLQQHDVGRDFVRTILANLNSVFPRVTIFQVTPGELLLIAACDPKSLLDEDLLTRLQKDHFVRELASSGWDWSQVAALPVLDTADPVGIYQETAPKIQVSSASGWLSLGLALEGMRWGQKTSELMVDFGRYQQRLADAAPRGSGYAEYARRFSAVVQQAEILSARFDYTYEYRNSLRIEMQQHARPPVETTINGKTKKLPDPRDEYRKDYFRALGAVLNQLQQADVDPLTLAKLTRFTGRYEPLLSFFAHDELIRIHEKAEHPSPALEFLHRLHTIYYSDGRDYNVRRVAKAIQQLVDDPQLVANDQQRFDHLNSLVQELVRRWQGRVGYEPPSATRTQFEVDLCIKTTNRALEAMSGLKDSVAMPQEEFLARRAYINQELVSRLRDYSQKVLAHRIRTEKSGKEIESKDSILIQPNSLLTN